MLLVLHKYRHKMRQKSLSYAEISKRKYSPTLWLEHIVTPEVAQTLHGKSKICVFTTQQISGFEKWGRSIQSRWEKKRGLEEMRNEFRIRSYTHPYMKMINKPRGPYFTLCLIPQGLVLQCVWEWHWAKSSGFPWCQALKNS